MKNKLKELRKQIIKDFGPKCKSFSILCACCLAHRALEDLEDLMEIEVEGRDIFEDKIHKGEK